MYGYDCGAPKAMVTTNRLKFFVSGYLNQKIKFDWPQIKLYKSYDDVKSIRRIKMLISKRRM